MTLHDLSQLLYLRKEIAVEQRRLEELEKASRNTANLSS